MYSQLGCAFFFDQYVDRLRGKTTLRYFFENIQGARPEGSENAIAYARAMAKAKQESKRTWDLIGWKQIPQLAMEQGWFNELGKSPVECVFYTDFEDIAARISEFRVLNR